MNVWRLVIRKVSNGYILSGRFGDSDMTQEVVIDDKDELKAMQNVLFEVMEYFGVYGSKHDRERLYVEVREQKDEDTEEGGE